MKRKNWQQVKDIFVDVVQQVPEDRQKFLEKACNGNKDIHREVESLLSSYDSAESFMEFPAVVELAESFEAGIPQLESGQTLGHYEIIRQIGKGGMGEVYLAHDKTLDRKVAVKVFYESFSRDESNLRRFIHEAKAASGLNHPNILVIHEIGETENAHYIVSEYVEGRTLRELLKNRPLKLPQVLDFSIQIAGALTAAHEAHLIHRDIKPENLIIRPDGFVKVLDFGLAKLVEHEGESSIDLEAKTRQQNVTAKGVILGTANYMSPEQAQGKDTDEGTDIWSLGVVLYEMLSGKLPFEGKTINHTIVSIIENEPMLVESIPNAMQRIITKALTKEKEDRYQATRDLLIDLKNLKRELEVQGEIERSVKQDKRDKAEETEQYDRHPKKLIESTDTEGAGFKTQDDTHLTNDSSLEHAVNQAKSHKLGIALVGVLLLGMISTAIYFVFSAEITDQIDSIAVMPFVNAGGDNDAEYLSDGMTETLIGSLSHIPGLSVKARSSVFRYKGKEVDAKKIGKELNVEAVLLGRVIQRGEDLSITLELVDAQTENVLWTDRFDRTMSNLVALQSEIAREVSGKLRQKLTSAEQERVVKAYTKNSEAQKLYLQGRFHWNKRGRTKIESAIGYFKQAIEKDPAYALAYTGLADTYAMMPMYAGGRPHEYMPLAKQAVKKALELDDDLAEAHASRGWIIYLYDYDREGAELEYKRAIELDPKNSNARLWYSDLLSNNGMHDEAIREISKILEPESNPAFFKLMMGNYLLWARRYDQAIVQYKEAIELDPGYVRAIGNLGYCYKAKGMYSEAVEKFLQVYRLEAKKTPEEIQKLKEAYEKGSWKAFTRTKFEINSKERKLELEKEPTAYIRSRLIAEDYADLKHKEKTLEYLNKMFEERDYYLMWLKNDFSFDFLRDDPRFKELIKKVGIPE